MADRPALSATAFILLGLGPLLAFFLVWGGVSVCQGHSGATLWLWLPVAPLMALLWIVLTFTLGPFMLVTYPDAGFVPYKLLLPVAAAMVILGAFRTASRWGRVAVVAGSISGFSLGSWVSARAPEP